MRALLVAIGLMLGGCGPSTFCIPNRAYCEGSILMVCSARGTDAYVAVDCCDFGVVCQVKDVQDHGCENATFARYPGACCAEPTTTNMCVQ